MATSQKLVLCCQSKFAMVMCFGPLFAVLKSSVRASGWDWPGAGHRCRVFGSTSVSGSELAPLCDACPGILDISQRFVTPTESGVAEPLSLGCCSVAAYLRARPTTPFWSDGSPLALPLLCGFSCSIKKRFEKVSGVTDQLFISTIPVTAPGASLGTNNLAV